MNESLMLMLLVFFLVCLLLRFTHQNAHKGLDVAKAAT